MKDLKQSKHIYFYFIRVDERYSVKVSKFVTPDNMTKCLKLKGLPFAANEEDIVEFFKSYDVVKTQINNGLEKK